MTPTRHGGPPRWDPPPSHRHDHSRLAQSADHLQEFSSPRNSQEMDRRDGEMNDHRVNSDGRLNDMYRSATSNQFSLYLLIA